MLVGAVVAMPGSLRVSTYSYHEPLKSQSPGIQMLRSWPEGCAARTVGSLGLLPQTLMVEGNRDHSQSGVEGMTVGISLAMAYVQI